MRSFFFWPGRGQGGSRPMQGGGVCAVGRPTAHWDGTAYGTGGARERVGHVGGPGLGEGTRRAGVWNKQPWKGEAATPLVAEPTTGRLGRVKPVAPGEAP